MNVLKTTLLLVLAAMLLAVGSVSVSADPYNGYNTIGGIHTYATNYAYGTGLSYYNNNHYGHTWSVANPTYAYYSAPRAGGWFSNGAGWVTGLRTPVYGHLEPTHYSSLDRPRCINCKNYGYYGYGHGGNSNLYFRARFSV